MFVPRDIKWRRSAIGVIADAREEVNKLRLWEGEQAAGKNNIDVSILNEIATS